MQNRSRDLRQLVLGSMDVPREKQELIPRGFQVIGSIAILNLRPGIREMAARIAGLMLGEYPHIRTVCISGGVSGEMRKPSVKWLSGERTTVTEHRENGCLYRLDVARAMFSKGNLPERGRLPGIVRPGERVLDMFAGIGYFTIPIAKKAEPGKVLAIEKNPESFRYLKENIRLNKVQGKVEPLKGDCRKLAPQGWADRIVMGYLPGTDRFLPCALRALKPGGGIIHYHDNFHERELWNKPLEILEREARKEGYALEEVERKAVVKEYSPNMFHCVIDARLRPSP